MEPLTADDPGQIADYRLRARLGSGGMGRVYLASTPGGRPVALKVVRPELGDDADFRGRFRQEVAAARRVHGLYTAQLLDADPDGSPPWLVTAYVPGPSLQQAVTENGPLPAGTVLLLMAGVAEALQAIHAAGVIHRDLKPSNVLLAADGPRVIDFGIARAAEATAVTQTGIRIGTPQFMAPEQVAGRAVSPATDVFALGVLAAYAAQGRPAFGDGNPSAIMYRVLHEPPDLGGCPPPVRDLVERCLAKDPGLRPAPGDIIAACRARTAAGEAGDWLPVTVAAGLDRHQPPSAPDFPATATVAPARGVTPATSAMMTTPPPGHRRSHLPRAAIAGAAAAVAAVLAIVLAVTLAPRGGGTPAAHGTGTPSSAARQAVAKKAGSPGPLTRLDSCLRGTWHVVTDEAVVRLGGTMAEVTGHGTIVIFRANGSSVTDYGTGVVFTPAGRVGGHRWRIVDTGLATARYQTRNGLLITSRVVAHGTITVYRDGTVVQRSALHPAGAANPYTCSGAAMRFTAISGGFTIDLSRA